MYKNVCGVLYLHFEHQILENTVLFYKNLDLLIKDAISFTNLLQLNNLDV